MAEKNNATCGICGRGYYVCHSCKDSVKLHPFKNFTDTAEHYKVFQVVRGYSTGVYTKDEAKEKFQNVDLQDLEDYMPHIKQIIKDILKEEKHIVENIIDEPVKVAQTMDETVAVKPTYSRKRNYKVNNEVVETE